ncbi:hypothetical protein KQI86_05535 [Clostridium sp. MSJ-11]|uniref:DUF5673 domain-containing protein n=1 Tax=Clostridium mobile TaxID=2841512 RepID=A0ABS6EFK0_9CLOT|nr:DUF5673 domain-containing protein [Clostridium mobile]MBU5483785.1 hypothetical protein [Clostridium mobile]
MINYYIILNIIMSCFLLYGLYEKISAGKFIIQTRRKKISILYVVILVLWICITSVHILFYIKNKSIDIKEILQGFTWIQIGILNLLSRQALGVTKGGTYSSTSNSCRFIKWNKIKSYTWISENKIQLETLGRRNKIIERELEVDEEQKEEVDKLLNEFINKKDNEINEKRNFRAIAYVVLIGIVMFIGYANLIRIS